MKLLFALVTAVPAICVAGAATAGNGSYSGTWRVALTGNMYVTNDGYRHGPNSTHCVTLTDDGSGDEPASWVFSTTASGGTIAPSGAYDELQDGESYVVARATFAARGAC
jgi:hypothetical protein